MIATHTTGIMQCAQIAIQELLGVSKMNMHHTTMYCFSCGTELQIKIAKGDNAPERVVCKACSQGKQPQPKQRVNLARAQGHNFRDVDRAISMQKIA